LIGRDDIVGKRLLEVRPDINPRFLEILEEVRSSGRSRVSQEAPIVVGKAPDDLGCERWLDCIHQPIPDPDGTVRRVFVEGYDVTARKLAREQLEDSETRTRLALQATGAGVWEWSLDDNRFIYSARAREICGFPPQGEVTFDMVVAATHPEDYPFTSAQARRALDPALRDRTPYRYRLVRPDGTIRHVAAYGEVVFTDRDGEVKAQRYIGTLIDITEQHDAEERLLLLAREVDHRANNLLAVVQSAVALSQADTAKDLKTLISGRVQALAKAHQLLAEGRWQATSLRRLLEEELSAFVLGDPDRIAIVGEDRALSPPQAQAVAMCIHELATNAAKHGALSRPGGRVHIQIAPSMDGGDQITWTERGGPPVQAPSRRGFGSSILKLGTGQGAGSAVLDWRPEGLVCELELAARPQGRDVASAGRRPERSSSRRRNTTSV
jgi:PAS domain S-box-containing protein